ncbi:hypothetical protein QVD17_26903 [Tagetes erecta]|uniref:Uncharacterized protein n=1 Tax=Tagetes erecta TaxID=13708 RepID=A0AAD8NQJ3_TARER|nr:hypothetical protein QVD17_26903 [Tagetes erecta]
MESIYEIVGLSIACSWTHEKSLRIVVQHKYFQVLDPPTPLHSLVATAPMPKNIKKNSQPADLYRLIEEMKYVKDVEKSDVDDRDLRNQQDCKK